MAMSCCPKCGNTNFSVVEGTPNGSNYVYTYVQCSSCGAVVGVMDYFSISTKIDSLEKELKKEIQRLSSNDEILNNNLITIINILNNR